MFGIEMDCISIEKILVSNISYCKEVIFALCQKSGSVTKRLQNLFSEKPSHLILNELIFPWNLPKFSTETKLSINGRNLCQRKEQEITQENLLQCCQIQMKTFTEALIFKMIKQIITRAKIDYTVIFAQVNQQSSWQN